MIRITSNLWIGTSADGWYLGNQLGARHIGAVLNVAHDLWLPRGWPDAECMQVGLIDGPGNPLYLYVAAILSLSSLLKRHETLVCCHGGERSLVVAIMYLNACGPDCNRTWNEWMSVLSERMDEGQTLPSPVHPAHQMAFDRINWKFVRSLLAQES